MSTRPFRTTPAKVFISDYERERRKQDEKPEYVRRAPAGGSTAGMRDDHKFLGKTTDPDIPPVGEDEKAKEEPWGWSEDAATALPEGSDAGTVKPRTPPRPFIDESASYVPFRITKG